MNNNNNKEKIKNDLTIYTINNIDYYDSMAFCRLIKKSKVAINKLIRDGNKIRKMKCLRIGTKSFIPVSELTEYPFTTGGHNNTIYYHNKKGERISAEQRYPELF